jgi:xanthine dehydrogenase YagS FAD-binding subunit
MKSFQFIRARTSTEAAEQVAAAENAHLHGGGCDLLDRMKERIDEPSTLVSLCAAEGLGDIRIEQDGSLWIGARVTLAELSESAACKRFLPTLSEAAGHAASPQLRHRATIGGNLAQHTRCGYYRHKSFPCLKRGGDSCPVRADGGVQDTAGIFGNQACASAHPSSVAPVLGALDVEIAIRDAKTLRFVRFEDFWSAPEPGRASDTTLKDGEVIEGIRVPARDAKQFVGYAEVRQRKAFDWALVSCAVRYETDADGKVTTSRAWFGSLAPAPLRAAKAEAALLGQVCSDAIAAKAGDAFLADATPLEGTTFKVQLAKVALKRALAAARERA